MRVFSRCQADAAAVLRKNKGETLARQIANFWRHPSTLADFAAISPTCYAASNSKHTASGPTSPNWSSRVAR